MDGCSERLDQNEYLRYRDASDKEKERISQERAERMLKRFYNKEIQIISRADKQSNTMSGNIADIHAILEGNTLPIEVKSRARYETKISTSNYLQSLAYDARVSLNKHFNRPLYKNSPKGATIEILYDKPSSKCHISIRFYWRITNTPSLFFGFPYKRVQIIEVSRACILVDRS